MIDRHRLTLTDDLISDLICAEDDGDHLTHDELLMLAATLLSAGTDPTPPTANSPQPSSLYSGPRPTNPKPHSDWTTKRVPLTATQTGQAGRMRIPESRQLGTPDTIPLHPQTAGRNPDFKLIARSKSKSHHTGGSAWWYSRQR